MSRYRQSNSGIRFSAINCEIAGYLSLIHLKNLGTPMMEYGAVSAYVSMCCGFVECGLNLDTLWREESYLLLPQVPWCERSVDALNLPRKSAIRK